MGAVASQLGFELTCTCLVSTWLPSERLPVVLHTKEVLATGKQSLASLPKSSAKSTLGVVAVSVGR